MEGLVEEIRRASEENLEEVIKAYIEVLKIPAVNPSAGGRGELRRAEKLQRILAKFGLEDITRIDAADDRVEEGIRPNIVSIIEGEDRRRTLWLIAHMDTVPEGDLRLWKTDPYNPVIDDGKIYARGAEDNGQAIASMILAVKILTELGLRPKINLGLAFVSDEEAGSKYGLEYLVNKGIFKEEDEAIVLDYGSPDGSEIEIAEKHILWLKFTVHGVQAHAAFPHEGLNAHRVGARLLLALDQMLHDRFSDLDPIYAPPESTFEPTKKEPNIDNVNTVPGVDVFYFDCRVLPKYDLAEVLTVVDNICKAFESVYNVKIEVEEVMRWKSPPPTSPDEDVVKKLSRALKLMRGIGARVV
ncbi:MAG: diaminopimelate aminotransferase, partial [Thaumarchaeota archaeon]